MQRSVVLEKQYAYNHNGQTYMVSLTADDQHLEVKLDDPRSEECWRRSFQVKEVLDILEKTGKPLAYPQFVQLLSMAFERKTDTLFVDVMSSFDLESIKLKKGGQPSQQNMKANKRYVILSMSSGDTRTHYPLPLPFVEVESAEKLRAMIITVKEELENLRGRNVHDKSSSVMSESGTHAESMRQENQQLKQLIKESEEQLAQKKGAVEMDLIVREKNDLEMKVDAIRREENKEMLKLKSVFGLKERELNDIRTEIALITKELENGEQSNPKLKSHLMRVTKAHETQLNNSRKLLAKQTKEIENINRNIQTVRNNEKKLLAKIKALQVEIDQAKKKANVKEISNRLHSPASSKKSNYSAPSKPVLGNQVHVPIGRHSSTRTDDRSSEASKDSKPRSYNGPVRTNLVKPAVNRVVQPNRNARPDPLARTTPALTSAITSKNKLQPSTLTRPFTRNTPPVPRKDSTENNKESTSLEKRQNNYVGGSKPRIPVSGPLPSSNSRAGNSREPLNPANKRSTSREVKPTANQQSSSRVPVYNARPKHETSEKEKNIFNKIEEIKNRFSKGPAPQPPVNRTLDLYKRK